jgi:single-strand DNA-binding protein
MASVNKVFLLGNACADAEIRRTNDGRSVATIRLATTDSWRDKNSGERKEKTEFHRVVIFNDGLCKVAEQYVKKGTRLWIEGALQTRKWTDQAGVEKYSTEVVLQNFGGQLVLLGDPQRDEPKQTYGDAKPPKGNAPQAPRRSMKDEMSDDIPFGPEWR